MSTNQSIPANFAVPIEVEPLLDKFLGTLKTGLTTVKMKVRRRSDGFVLDWDDATFKAVGSVVQLLSPAFTEFDATAFPGEYQSSLALDTLVATGTHDVYLITIVEDASPTTVGNLPQVGEVRVEQALSDAVLARQALYNDHDLAEGSLDNLELKDDAGAVVIARWNIKDKNGLGITLPAGFPATRERTL